MTRSRQAWIAAAALALLALGLLAGAYRLRRDGGAVEILSLADPAGTLYLPESAGAREHGPGGAAFGRLRRPGGPACPGAGAVPPGTGGAGPAGRR